MCLVCSRLSMGHRQVLITTCLLTAPPRGSRLMPSAWIQKLFMTVILTTTTLASRRWSAPTCCASTARWWSVRSTCSCVWLSVSMARMWRQVRLWCRNKSWVRQLCDCRCVMLHLGRPLAHRPVGQHSAQTGLSSRSTLVAAVETYHLLSQRWFTHASPTLFNAGTPRPQLSSCFLVCMKNDSIEGAKQQWSLFVVACATRCSCARELVPYPPPCHTPLLKAFMTPSKSVPASQSLRAALVFRCTTSAPPARTFEAPMAPAMESCPCCACSMTQVGRC